MSLRPQHRRTRLAARGLLLGLPLLALMAPAAQAATSANGNQAVTGTPSAALTATFPSDYAFVSFAAGSSNASSEQLLTVKSNLAWGVKISSDQSSGFMRDYASSSYGSTLLTNPLEWSTTTGGSTSYAALSSTATSVVTGKAATSDSGTSIGVTYRQPLSFADDGSKTYRILVTYAAAQGF